MRVLNCMFPVSGLKCYFSRVKGDAKITCGESPTLPSLVGVVLAVSHGREVKESRAFCQSFT